MADALDDLKKKSFLTGFIPGMILGGILATAGILLIAFSFTLPAPIRWVLMALGFLAFLIGITVFAI